MLVISLSVLPVNWGKPQISALELEGGASVDLVYDAAGALILEKVTSRDDQCLKHATNRVGRRDSNRSACCSTSGMESWSWADAFASSVGVQQ